MYVTIFQRVLPFDLWSERAWLLHKSRSITREGEFETMLMHFLLQGRKFDIFWREHLSIFSFGSRDSKRKNSKYSDVCNCAKVILKTECFRFDWISYKQKLWQGWWFGLPLNEWCTFQCHTTLLLTKSVSNQRKW